MLKVRQRSAAFTLIELLVVVAIISVLVALLVPALKRAKDNATATMCGSNMRHIYASEAIYSSESLGMIGFQASWNIASDSGEWEQFLLGDVSGSGHMPDYILPAYLTGPNMLVCPSMPPYVYNTNSGAYGINLDSVDTNHLMYNTILHPMGFLPQTNFVPGKMCSNGSGVLIFAKLSDAVDAATGPMLLDSVLPFVGPSQVDTVAVSHPIQFPGTYEHHVHARHIDQSNVLFWDGHVERLNIGQLKGIGAQSDVIIDENMNLVP